MVVRTKKELEMLLNQTPPFPRPKQFLEQYLCDSRIASEMLWNAYISGDIRDKIVADLGCGTGMLAYGALILGSKEVICIDIDCEAILTAKNFLSSKNLFNASFICADVNVLSLRAVDTIVMNPPFGVYRQKSDMQFLESALRLRPRAIYTIHKYSQKLFNIIKSKLDMREDDFKMLPLLLDNMIIHASYGHHRKRVHRFRIIVLKIKREVEAHG
ncbi:MAG: METTL5 family protein [Ignisphaera sp.]